MKQAINFLTKKEEIFHRIVEMYGIPEVPMRPQGFQTLVLLILEQQVSIEAAKATFNKLKSQVENFLPEDLIVLSDQIYRSCGVSRQKTKYIKGLSEEILNKTIDLETLELKSEKAIREELIKIKGIGNWTIDIYLMFCLQKEDVIPLGDIAVVNTIKELLDIHTKEEMENYTQKWKPYRSMATYFLWHYYLRKRNRTVNY